NPANLKQVHFAERVYAPIRECVSFTFNPIGFLKSHRTGYKQTWKDRLLAVVSYASIIVSWILVSTLPLVSLVIYTVQIIGVVSQKISKETVQKPTTKVEALRDLGFGDADIESVIYDSKGVYWIEELLKKVRNNEIPLKIGKEFNELNFIKQHFSAMSFDAKGYSLGMAKDAYFSLSALLSLKHYRQFDIEFNVRTGWPEDFLPKLVKVTKNEQVPIVIFLPTESMDIHTTKVTTAEIKWFLRNKEELGNVYFVLGAYDIFKRYGVKIDDSRLSPTPIRKQIENARLLYSLINEIEIRGSKSDSLSSEGDILNARSFQEPANESEKQKTRKKGVSIIWAASAGAGLLITYLSSIVWIFLPITFLISFFGHYIYNKYFGTGTKADASLTFTGDRIIPEISADRFEKIVLGEKILYLSEDEKNKMDPEKTRVLKIVIDRNKQVYIKITIQDVNRTFFTPNVGFYVGGELSTQLFFLLTIC
ncbi:hypothetical protein ACFL58_03115, partial [Elusimicrobiota bacterium]